MGNHFAAEVHLDHEVYYPGNVVRGEATISVDKPLKCIAARIMCRGFERAVVVNHSNEMIYNVFEDTVFYKETLTLFGHTTKDPDASPVEIPPGVYTYPFAFQLPMHLPESMHTANWTSGGAEVKYQVITFVKIDNDHIEEGHHDFTVVTPINRRDMLASEPLRGEATAKLTKMFADKGSCDFTVSLPRSIYAADDTIEGEIVIDNTNGLSEIGHVRVSLVLRCDIQLSGRNGPAERDTSRSNAMMSSRMHAGVAPKAAKKLPFRIQLPHTVPAASYPARGINIALFHMLGVEVAGTKLELPVHIAHCADDENRFEFTAISDIAHKPEHRDTEHAYTVPAGFVASPCESLQPPAALPIQPTPTAVTPQAVGNGQMHARVAH